MPDKIKIALAGFGNVASTLAKGLEFYKNSEEGLWHPRIGGLTLNDIMISAVYDIDATKVGKSIGDVAGSDASSPGIIIQPGIISDAVPSHISQNGQARTESYEDFVNSLKSSKPDFFLNLISSGLDKTSGMYCSAALEAGCSFFNATSARTVTDEVRKSFEAKGQVILGDDLMSQFGGTAFHRGMIDFMISRGIRIQKAYQLDVGGNQDTKNTMVEDIRERKRNIKTESIAIESPYPFRSAAGTTEYAEQLGDSRVSYYWMEAKGFLGSPVEMDLSLRTKDSTNGCNVIVDALRAARYLLSKNDLDGMDVVSAYAFKNPARKMHIRDCIKSFEDSFAS
ncbi:MAG: hypothetical protein KGI33_06105 [Thaumarchaeota archaeon]|nr:hypothetical protein [Nitrososphaerota archaeon]